METQASANIVNGIDVDGLKALVGDVAEGRTTPMTRWRASTAWSGGFTTRTRVHGTEIGGETLTRAFVLDTDEPEPLGGADANPNPQDYLLAGINACMCATYAAQAALRGVVLEFVEIELEGDIDLRGFFGLAEGVAPGFEALRYTVRIKGDASAEVFEEIHQAVMATSPNFYNAANAIEMRPTLEVA